MKRGQSYEGVAKAAQPVDQDPFCRASHCVTLVCLVRWLPASAESGATLALAQEGEDVQHRS
jgi:hypothetical protein